MRKKYKISVDIWAILLFLAIMLPNFIWFVFPAPNDILGAESITPILDGGISMSGSALYRAMLIIWNLCCKPKKYTVNDFLSGLFSQPLVVWYIKFYFVKKEP